MLALIGEKCSLLRVLLLSDEWSLGRVEKDEKAEKFERVRLLGTRDVFGGLDNKNEDEQEDEDAIFFIF